MRFSAARRHNEAAEVVRALYASGPEVVAERIARCAAQRRHRVPGRRPWTCRGIGCPWCGRGLVQRWWYGLRAWVSAGDGPTTLIQVPLAGDDVRPVVRYFRRALRDTRDRAGRRDRRWREVEFGGLYDGLSVTMCVRHPGVDLGDLLRVVLRRWPGAGSVDDCVIGFPLALHIDLARFRRGIEPCRVVVAAQGVRVPVLVVDDLPPLPVVI